MTLPLRAEETCFPTLILAGPWSCRLSCVKARRALLSTCIRLMVIVFYGGYGERRFGRRGTKRMNSRRNESLLLVEDCDKTNRNMMGARFQ